ncbi:TetR family transcriptional regulator [Curtobacterium sp. SGAir0471]|uniref:TetR/AcrR family transcriptional regulator n=1 Tax=Curtobacterium sp. SGAir0471 TaxID=2070337 RepID=UPI0010CD50E4|nr:TetR/AcrR family transcriptional regulator [Curtobacterium sp. SGAir0471]QCR44151.1 TetR family transcriptional regulator [Curtobacterium sp. SGAir0471]
MGRREDLADAAVRLVARGGSRSLTHRGVDAEAGLPSGSTTYYASTRRALLALVTARITEQLASDVARLRLPEDPDDAAVAAVATGFLDALAARGDAQAARLALLVELRDDTELRAPLTGSDPVRDELVRAARTLLDGIGVDGPDAAARDLVGVVDALLLYRVGAVGPVDPAAVLTAYVAGLPRR